MPSDIDEPCGIYLELAGNFAHDREVDTIVGLRPVILVGPVGGVAHVSVSAEALADRQLDRIRAGGGRIGEGCLRGTLGVGERRGGLAGAGAPRTGGPRIGAPRAT